MVSFLDSPAGPDVQPAPPTQETSAVPLPPVKTVVGKPIIPKPKPIAKPKLVAKPKPVRKPKPARSKALSKLDELAKLKKVAVPKKDKLAMAAPKPLDDFKSMKMKTAAEKKPTRKKIEKDDLTIKELEFEQLSKKSASRQSQSNPKKTSSLSKQMDELKQMNKQHASLSKPKLKKTDSKPSEFVKQLEAIKNESVQIKIDTSKLSPQHSKQFKSEIRDLKMAEIQRRVAVPTSSGELGDPAADALSKYVGKVYVKIYKNWKDPLGGGNGMVQVSFSIFPQGNIANPEILKSSGDSKLDNLAIRAIKNAVPLPPFPKEIKEPNLPLILKFAYVPKN